MLSSFDSALMNSAGRVHASSFKRFVMECFFFTVKQARACLFSGLFFLAVVAVPRSGFLGLPRYDVLLAIALFHLLGLGLELFKTSGAVGSWSYPDPAFTKVFGVPLFSGFMYAAVGSYIIQAWRLFDLKVKHHPPYWMAAAIALLIYANFFTHHYIGDYRWYIAACALGLYARSTVVFRPADRERRMPLLSSFLLIGFFLWLAENISTFFGIWAYPDQLRAWSVVHLGHLAPVEPAVMSTHADGKEKRGCSPRHESR